MSDRIDITFSRGRDYIPILEKDRFKPVLYKNLFIPSYVHSYSLAIEYMKKWFLEKFETTDSGKENIMNGKDSTYFKYVHINGKHMFDDYKRFNKQNIKREKPLCIITPTVEHDWDRDNLDLYNAGADIYLKRSRFQDAFFKDYKSNRFVSITMKELQMNFNFRVRVSTRAQQLDLVDKMKLLFRVGGTQREYKTVDIILPKDIVLNLAHDAGYKISNQEVEDSIGFLAYLNSHSQLPIMYKLRNINNKLEYYMRVPNIHCHISNLDQLQVDDGEREGQLDNNFNIDMQCILKISVPHFLVYYSVEPLYYKLNTDIGGIGLYTLSQFIINPINEKGWDTFINTEYKLDKGEKYINFKDVFENTALKKVIDYNIERHISPKMFIDIEIYKDRAGIYSKVYSEMNYNTMELNVEEALEEEYIYIVVYVDKLYLNTILEEITKMNSNNRIQ